MHATAPVPGSVANATVLLDGPEVPFGLIKLRNVGEWPLAVGALDARNKVLQPHLFLKPGHARASFVPPAHARKIILIGTKLTEDEDPNATGTAELDYDVPWYG